MSERPSGWYDDPDDDTQLRYWDGILWTERRTPKLKPGLDGSQIGTPSAYERRPEEPATPAPREARFARNTYDGPATPQAGWAAQPVRAGATTADGQRLSGWWRRFVAWLIDGFITGLVGTLLAYPWARSWIETYQAWFSDTLAAAARGSTEQPEMPSALAQLPIGWVLTLLVVFAVYEIGLTVWRGRTLGKVVTGISVRAADTPRKPTLDEAVKRFAVKGAGSILRPFPALSLVAAIFTLVDGLWPLGDRRRQAIHDKVARTVVVIGRPDGTSKQPPAGPLP